MNDAELVFDKVERDVEEAKKEEKAGNKKSYKREKVCEERVPYDPGYMYYLDKRGNVYRSPRSVGQKRLRRREKVLEININKKPNHLYYVNNLGEIWCVEMNRGGIKGVKHKRLYFAKDARRVYNVFIQKLEELTTQKMLEECKKDALQDQGFKEEIRKLIESTEEDGKVKSFDECFELLQKNIREEHNKKLKKEYGEENYKKYKIFFREICEILYYKIIKEGAIQATDFSEKPHMKTNIKELVQQEKTDDINEDFKRYLASLGAKIV